MRLALENHLFSGIERRFAHGAQNLVPLPMDVVGADEFQPAQRRYCTGMDRHHAILHYHDVLHAQHRKQRVKASKCDIVRCAVRIPAFAPVDEFGIAARDTGVVAPGVERSQGHRGIRIPKVENAILAGMLGEKLAQLRDDE